MTKKITTVHEFGEAARAILEAAGIPDGYHRCSVEIRRNEGRMWLIYSVYHEHIGHALDAESPEVAIGNLEALCARHNGAPPRDMTIVEDAS